MRHLRAFVFVVASLLVINYASGHLRAFVFVVASLLVINYASAGLGIGGCPPKNKVYNDKPTCFSDADCQKYGKVCCPNQFNTKSCVARSPWFKSDQDKYSGGGGGGKYCAGVKCMPYEVCKPDPITKRLKCQRP